MNFSHPEILTLCPWSFSIEPIITGSVALIVQSFYGYRVFILSQRSKVIPTVIFSLAIIQFAWAIASTAQIFEKRSLFSLFQTFNYGQSLTYWNFRKSFRNQIISNVILTNQLLGVTVWLSCASICDLIITASLVYYLSKAKTSHGHSNHILTSIMTRTVETGSLSM